MFWLYSCMSFALPFLKKCNFVKRNICWIGWEVSVLVWFCLREWIKIVHFVIAYFVSILNKYWNRFLPLNTGTLFMTVAFMAQPTKKVIELLLVKFPINILNQIMKTIQYQRWHHKYTFHCHFLFRSIFFLIFVGKCFPLYGKGAIFFLMCITAQGLFYKLCLVCEVLDFVGTFLM